jgi:ribosomal protein S18 acetylase RimI-like enzyme
MGAAATTAEDAPRVRVRRAVDADALAVAHAVRELLVELGGTPPDVAMMEAAARTVIADGDASAVLVAEHADGGTLVGVLAASFLTTVHAGGPYGLIQDLWVAAEARSSGLGGRLVSEFCSLAAARGATRIEVGIPRDGFPALVATRRFYERNGFEILGARMRRRVAA